jgi:hypothetical protein
LNAGWLRFDAVAAKWLGLDSSKYEWAEIEKELEERSDLEAIASDGVQLMAKVAALEEGLSSSTPDIAKAAPVQAQPMSRSLLYAAKNGSTSQP